MRIKLNWQGKVLIPSSLLDDKRVTPGSVRLFALLMGLREEDRDISLKEIANILSHSTTTIKKYMDNLVKTGWAEKSEEENYISLRMYTPLKRKRSL